MAIIAILVLLAAPRFLGRTEDAVASRIKNDIRVAETKLDEYLIRHENLDNWESSVSFSDLEDHQSNGALYDREGLMDGEDSINEGNYSVVPSDFVEREVTSQLDGDFYANEEGHVYYSPILGDGHGADDEDLTGDYEVPEGYVLATDDDFMWIEGDWAPDGKGYYVYTGSDDFVYVPNVIHGDVITHMYSMFGGYTAWNEERERYWWYGNTVQGVATDNPYVTSAFLMFDSLNEQREDLSEIDISLDMSHFHAPNIEDFSDMFNRAIVDEIILSERFDTSNATTMYGMFSLLESPKGRDVNIKLDVSVLDTSNVEDMSRMFTSSNIESLDLSNFDTSNVTNMQSMFSQLRTNELDISSFDTANVTDMYSLFNRYSGELVDISGFDTSNVTNMGYMFNGNNREELDLSHFVTENVTNMSYMFQNVKVGNLDLSNFNTSQVTNMRSMFHGIEADELNVSSFDTSNVTNMNSMFYSNELWAEEGQGPDLTGFDTSNVTDMSWMFAYSPLDEIDLSSFDMSNVTTYRDMFSNTGLGTGKGYARTQEDADILNNIFGSSFLRFIVK